MANKENKKKIKAWKQKQPKQKYPELVTSLTDCNIYFDGKRFESVSK